MQAVANNPEFAKKVGVNQSVGQEFTKEKSMKTKKMNMGGMADRRGRAMTRMGADAAGRAMMMKGGKVKKMKAGGNTSRMNELEELGRVDAEKGYSTKGKRNLKDEKARVVREIKNKKAGGKVKGYDKGGKVTMTSMMKDKEGRALAKNKKKMTAKQMKDAAGRMMGKPARAGKAADMKAATKAKIGTSLRKKAKGKKMMMMKGGKVKAYKKGGSVGHASKRADGIAKKGRTKGRMV